MRLIARFIRFTAVSFIGFEWKTHAAVESKSDWIIRGSPRPSKKFQTVISTAWSRVQVWGFRIRKGPRSKWSAGICGVREQFAQYDARLIYGFLVASASSSSELVSWGNQNWLWMESGSAVIDLRFCYRAGWLVLEGFLRGDLLEVYGCGVSQWLMIAGS